MEMKNLEGSEIEQVAPDEASENSINTDKFTDDAAGSLCLVREEFGEMVPEADGVSSLADKELTLAQDRSETLCDIEKEREAYEQFAKQTEKHSIETLERALELDYLRVIFESRAEEMEQMVSSLQEEVLTLHQKLDQYEQTQEQLNKREENMTKDAEELKHSEDDLKHANMLEDSLARFKDLETALLNSQQNEHELKERLIAAEEKACINEDVANSTTKSLFEAENLAEVLCGISNDAKYKLDRAEQDLKSASEQDFELRNKLKDTERKLLMQETTAQSATTRATDLEQLLTKMKLHEAKDIHAFPEVISLSNKLNILVDCVKESDEQASHASVSALAKEVELQVLYAKLAEVETLLQNLQGQNLGTENRAQTAEAECSFLADKNLKVNGDFAHIQVQMDELRTTLHQIERTKQSATYQVISTTKSINDLTEQLANERQRFQKQISTLVNDKNDLTEKYLSLKNELQYFLFKHESKLEKAKEREEVLKGNFDLKSRLGMPTAVDMHVAHLEQKFQLAETKLQGQSEGLHSESKAASLGDFGRSMTSDLMNDKTEAITEGQAEPVSHVGTSVNANATGHFIFYWILTLAVGLVSVLIGLIQWKKFQDH